MLNIAFDYLYRDGANYKNFGTIIFENEPQLDITELEELIKAKLIDGQYFYASAWKVPDLHFDTWDNETDHTFHEFESLTYINQPADPLFNLGIFINCVKNTVLL